MYREIGWSRWYETTGFYQCISVLNVVKTKLKPLIKTHNRTHMYMSLTFYPQISTSISPSWKLNIHLVLCK